MKNLILMLMLGIMAVITVYIPSATGDYIPSPARIAFDGSLSEDEVPPCSKGRSA